MNKIAVLGAGTMGSRIAAHFANAGCDVLLLDISAQLAEAGVRNALTAKPPAFFEEKIADRISTGSFDQDLPRLIDGDWIVEAVAENLEIKRNLLSRVARYRRHGSILSTNTSGLPVAQIVAGLGDDELRRHWLGVHFFNPPRYMRLVEIIPTPETASDVIDAVRRFASERLGKTVVQAKDTPNFIANRIGLFALFNSARLMQEFSLTIEQVDLLTGSLIGWPNTGTFRLMDLIGLDVLANMQRNFSSRVTDERSDVVTPRFLETLVARGALGDKTGAGFYKKGQPLLALDWRTMEYRPAQTRAPNPIASLRTPAERIRALCASDGFSQRMLTELGAYAEHRVPEIADTPASIDEAMRAGFNWQLGPFEMRDACRGSISPGLATPQPTRMGGNSSVSLIDIGDDIACIKLHSKMNAIGDEIMSFIPQVLNDAHFSAYVIATDAPNFSAGANLADILRLIEEKNWTALASFIQRFQDMTQSVKFSTRPVVSAVCGLCLGGGAELAMHSTKRQAHAELSMGLVESSVGLIPGGGGCKELALLASATGLWLEAFNLLATGARSSSAAQACTMHLLHPNDAITMGRDRLLLDAKAAAIQLAYHRPQPQTNLTAASTESRAAIHSDIEQRQRSGAFSDHDATVAGWIAKIILAEHVTPGSAITEQDYLDAEREAFVALCAEPKTAERIAYTLKTGKPLRN